MRILMYLDSYCRSEKKLLLLLLTITKIICLGSLDNFSNFIFVLVKFEADSGVNFYTVQFVCTWFVS